MFSICEWNSIEKKQQNDSSFLLSVKIGTATCPKFNVKIKYKEQNRYRTVRSNCLVFQSENFKQQESYIKLPRKYSRKKQIWF